MAVTTGQSGVPAGARWHLLLRPRWLAWHSFVVIATVGMLLLGDWQLHRAESGNELSWAYTFEWPLFAAFTVYFWIKSLRDELREQPAAVAAEPRASATEAVSASPVADASPVAGASPVADASSGVGASPGAGSPAVEAARPARAGRRAASWDATSWDATNWDATGLQVSPDDTGEPVDLRRATPADGEAYVARLMAEVRSGRRQGRR
jgi:DNA-binding transcriptional regulator of glucitol operon